MSGEILKSKILPDVSIPNIIVREKLLKKLRQNSDKSLIAVIAGAGYGKTTLVKEFLNEYELKNSWYKIDSLDEDVYMFFSYINASIKEIIPGFGKPAEELIPSLKSRSSVKSGLSNIVNTIGATIINDFIQNVKDELYFVIDDFHLLPESEWVRSSMQFLLSHIPQNLHIIITSRENPQFDTSVLSSKRKYFEITPDELKLNFDESKKLAESIYSVELTNDDFEKIYENTEGWVTGLHLFFQSGETKFKKEEKLIPETFYNFFAENIFNSLHGDIQIFLVRTCILENFNSKICNYLLNIKNSERILKSLVEKNIFILKSGELYNYQTLFRNYLNDKLFSGTTAKERKTIFKNIADFYLLNNEQEKTINFLLLAEDYKTSLTLISKNIQNVLESGNINIINKWLNRIPVELTEKSTDINYYRGISAKNIDADYEKALNYFSIVEKLSGKKIDRTFIKANTQTSEILINTGKIEEAKKKLNILLKKKLKAEFESYILYWLGVAYYQNGEYDKAADLIQKALAIANIENLNEIKYEMSNVLGNIYLIRGNFTKSLFFYENIIDKTKNIYHKLQTLTNIVQLYAHSGQYDKSNEMLNKCEEIQKRYPTPFFKINYLLAASHLHSMMCNYEKSIEIFIEFLGIVKKRGLSYYTYLSYLSLGYCYYFLKKYNKAEQYYELSGEFTKELSETEIIDLELSIAILKKKTKFSDGLEKIFMKAYDFFNESSLIYSKVQAAFNLADFYFKKGYTEKVTEYLKEFLNVSEENEYISLVQSELLNDRTLFDFAVENKMNIDFLQNVFNSINSIREYHWIDPGYKDFMKEKTDSLFDINVSFFGNFEMKFRGELIPDEKWLRKIRKLIFGYIILNRKRNLTKEDITEMFYSDSTSENAENIFYQLMSNVRGIFKNDYKFGKKTFSNSFISYEDKIIQLNPFYFYYVDSEEFENIYKKISGFGINESEKIYLIEKAVEIYKGDFLAGFYQTWCDELRDKYKDMYLEMLENIIDIFKEKQNYQKVIYYADKLVKADSLNEEAYLLLIKSNLKLYNNSSARSIAKQMIKIFKKELGEEPSKETMKYLLPIL